ncbi:MAG: MotA/TolQ/ExbB proton channel family protein [Rhodocyclaceae bacterium]|nr:MotA/TolQ/ExbB proton channel family protein [Rhodocyclaceae bacterium]
MVEEWQAGTIHILESLLYQTASALYLPVLAACAGLALYIPVQAGVAMFEAVQRGRAAYPWRAMFERELATLARSGTRNRELEVERLLQAQESAIARSLDRIRFVIKVGPSLGLMGTLIPMGIALSALSEGDISRMATSMVTAFTATVAGLFAGVGAYLLSLVRERWAREDLREITFIAECFLVDDRTTNETLTVRVEPEPRNELA